MRAQVQAAAGLCGGVVREARQSRPSIPKTVFLARSVHSGQPAITAPVGGLHACSSAGRTLIGGIVGGPCTLSPLCVTPAGNIRRRFRPCFFCTFDCRSRLRRLALLTSIKKRWPSMRLGLYRRWSSDATSFEMRAVPSAQCRSPCQGGQTCMSSPPQAGGVIVIDDDDDECTAPTPAGPGPAGPPEAPPMPWRLIVLPDRRKAAPPIEAVADKEERLAFELRERWPVPRARSWFCVARHSPMKCRVSY